MVRVTILHQIPLKKYNATLLGVRKGKDGEIMANPKGTMKITRDDSLIVVAAQRPVFSRP